MINRWSVIMDVIIDYVNQYKTQIWFKAQ